MQAQVPIFDSIMGSSDPSILRHELRILIKEQKQLLKEAIRQACINTVVPRECTFFGTLGAFIKGVKKLQIDLQAGVENARINSEGVVDQIKNTTHVTWYLVKTALDTLGKEANWRVWSWKYRFSVIRFGYILKLFHTHVITVISYKIQTAKILFWKWCGYYGFAGQSPLEARSELYYKKFQSIDSRGKTFWECCEAVASNICEWWANNKGLFIEIATSCDFSGLKWQLNLAALSIINLVENFVTHSISTELKQFIVISFLFIVFWPLAIIKQYLTIILGKYKPNMDTVDRFTSFCKGCLNNAGPTLSEQYRIFKEFADNIYDVGEQQLTSLISLLRTSEFDCGEFRPVANLFVISVIISSTLSMLLIIANKERSPVLRWLFLLPTVFFIWAVVTWRNSIFLSPLFTLWEVTLLIVCANECDYRNKENSFYRPLPKEALLITLVVFLVSVIRLNMYPVSTMPFICEHAADTALHAFILAYLGPVAVAPYILLQCIRKGCVDWVYWSDLSDRVLEWLSDQLDNYLT